jgi:hypothetical protein
MPAYSLSDLVATMDQIERCVQTLERLVRGLDAALQDGAADELTARLTRVSAVLPKLRNQIHDVTNDLNTRVLHDAASFAVDRRIGDRRQGDRRRRPTCDDIAPATTRPT